MPFIDVKANVSIDPRKEEALKRSLGEAIRLIPGKSESWLMLVISGNERLYFQGSDAPCAIAQISLYGGASREAYDRMTAETTRILAGALAIAPDRIYVNYRETDTWGWNGANF
ncbi:MAG: hypothetical protein IJ240_01795 [Clostridia bacterium]|nr:hypothetical protein [Clostridia bacterium]